MENNSLQQMNERATEVLQSSEPDRRAYDTIVDYIIKNAARQGDEPQFVQLTRTADEVALKFGFPSVAKVCENFGLNSCAQ